MQSTSLHQLRWSQNNLLCNFSAKFGVEILILLTKTFNLQKRALRIISFADFHAEINPLYSNLKIIKLSDQITLQNCLFVHDALKKVSPVCFHDYFKKTNQIHSIPTKSSSLGCLYVTKTNTVRYGLNSITRTCISNWNYITQKLNSDLTSLSRLKLKYHIKLHFLQSYS